MQIDLKEKTALVTGAGRGIGRAIAETMAQAGATVICLSRSESSCGSAAEAINAAGGKAVACAVDVADREALEAKAQELLKAHDIDILVNNAGITRDGLLMRLSAQDWDDVLNTNLTSCFTLCKALMRPMTKRRWGRILNVSSVSGLAGNAGQCNYAAAKSGLLGFSKSLARELASRQVTVNVIAPGFIRTDMTGGLSKEIVEAATSKIPLKRFGEAEEIAAMATFLASEQAAYITGQTFTVDGGMVM